MVLFVCKISLIKNVLDCKVCIPRISSSLALFSGEYSPGLFVQSFGAKVSKLIERGEHYFPPLDNKRNGELASLALNDSLDCPVARL